LTEELTLEACQLIDNAVKCKDLKENKKALQRLVTKKIKHEEAKSDDVYNRQLPIF
jgi:uncharacterized protein Yka (UPF0111/DUF47 family)